MTFYYKKPYSASLATLNLSIAILGWVMTHPVAHAATITTTTTANTATTASQPLSSDMALPYTYSPDNNTIATPSISPNATNPAPAKQAITPAVTTPISSRRDTIDINEMIYQAIQTHPLVSAARSDEQATLEGVNAAKLGLLPTPSFSTGRDPTNGLTSTLAIRQPLWTGGKLTASVNQAIYDDRAAYATIAEQQNTVAKNTIDIWQSYIYALALQQLYIQDLNRLNEFEAMMQRRVSQGVSARIELDLVTNRILQDQNAYQGAQEQQRIAEARLAQLLGHPVHASDGRVPMDAMVKYAKQQSQNFEQMAFNPNSITSPTVVKQHYQIEAAKQQVKVQQAARYPSLYAQYQDVYYHKTHANDGLLSVGLSYEPGAGFSNLALARASEAKVQSLQHSQEAAKRTAMEDIQTQYQQFVSTKDQETSLIAAVAGAQIVVDSYKRQFIAGRKSWLEVLNAVREQAQYQQQLLQVQSQILGSFYKLQVAFGTMPWQQQNTNLTAPVDEYHPVRNAKDWFREQSAKINQEIKTPASLSANTLTTQDTSLPPIVVTPDSNTQLMLPSVANTPDGMNDSAIIKNDSP